MIEYHVSQIHFSSLMKSLFYVGVMGVLTRLEEA